MAKTKVTLRLDQKLSLEYGFGKSFQERLGLQIIMMMREFIGSGLSPVQGVGRFVPYKAQRVSNDIKQFTKSQSSEHAGFYRKMQRQAMKNSRYYPNSVLKEFPGKQLRPINLDLSGSFLDTLSYEPRSGSLDVGHINIDEHTRNLFECHNEGLNKNVPQRKYLPNKRGDKFVVSIMQMIKDVYAEQLSSILKKK